MVFLCLSSQMLGLNLQKGHDYFLKISYLFTTRDHHLTLSDTTKDLQFKEHHKIIEDSVTQFVTALEFIKQINTYRL
jgi:hypothetical protein